MMKWLLHVLLALVLPSWSFAASVNGVSSPTSVNGVSNPTSVNSISMSASSHTDILLWWRAETVGHAADDYPTSGATWTLNSSAALNTDAANIGTNGLDAPGAQDYASLAVTSDDLCPTSGRIGFWFRVTTYITNARLFTRYVDSNNFWIVRLHGTDEVDFYWKDGGTIRTVLISTTANLSTGVWYYLEAEYDPATNTRKLYIDDAEVASDVSTAIGAVSGNGFIYFGNASAVASDTHQDNLGISNLTTKDLYSLRNETTSPR
jgi:hypothetical protein